MDAKSKQNPQDGSETHVDDRGGVDRADRENDESKECGVAPAATTQRQHGEGEQPRKASPRQENDRDTTGVLEEIRRQHVEEASDEGCWSGEVDSTAEVGDTGAGGEED